MLHPRFDPPSLIGPAALLAFPSFVYLSVSLPLFSSLLSSRSALDRRDRVDTTIPLAHSLSLARSLAAPPPPLSRNKRPDGTLDSTAHVRQKLFNADSSSSSSRRTDGQTDGVKDGGVGDYAAAADNNWHCNTCAAVAVFFVVVVGRVD